MMNTKGTPGGGAAYCGLGGAGTFSPALLIFCDG